MLRSLVVSKSGNIIGVSPDGRSALPNDIKRILEPLLVYTYKQRLYGYNKIDAVTGFAQSIHTEERRQYKYDKYGRLCCGAGFRSKIENTLSGLGLKVIYQDLSPPHPRSNRYEVSYDNIILESFRPRQEEALAAIITNDCGVIDAPPAFGKTHLIKCICKAFPFAKIHITTTRKDVVATIVRNLTPHFPSVGQVGGGRRKYGRITVFTADSLHLSDADCDILIADEVHELLSDSRVAELARYRYSRNYGLTATPEGRGDGTDARLESFFGPIIFSLTYPEAVSLGLTVPVRVKWLDTYMDSNPCAGKCDTAKKRWGLWRNEVRNALFAKEVRNYPDSQILMLVETIEHALYLRKHIPEFSLCYSENGISASDEEMYRRQKLLLEDEEIVTAQKRVLLRQDFEKGKLRKVIATEVWSTGVDFTGLQILVRVDGMESKIVDFQYPGRVCRIPDKELLTEDVDLNKEFGLVIDSMDHFDPGLLRKSNKRYSHYKDKGWEQTSKKKRSGILRSGTN